MLNSCYLLLGKKWDQVKQEQIAFQNYLSGIESLKADLDKQMYEFLTAEWHYDHRDKRCLHDMRLQNLIIKEEYRPQKIEIELTLLGAFFDRKLQISYKGVQFYSCGIPQSSLGVPPKNSHGDLMIDEMCPFSSGLWIHGLEFSRGTLYEFVFEEFGYEFISINSSG